MDLTTLLILFALFLLGFLFLKPSSTKKQKVTEEEPKTELKAPPTKQQPVRKTSAAAPKKQVKKVSNEEKFALLVRSLKGHQDDIFGLQWSPDGTLLLSCAKDRTFRLWQVKVKDANIPYMREHIEFNHATACCFSSDGKILALALSGVGGRPRSIVFYGIRTKENKPPEVKKLHSFETKHFDDINSLSISPDNKFVLTSVSTSDTHVYLYSLKGELLHGIPTNQLANSNSMLSSDGNLFAVATQMTSVRFWAVRRHKETQALEKPEVAMSLTGHKNGVTCVHISNDVKRAVTASLDGSWKLWNIDVRYKDREDPKEILSVTVDSKNKLGLIRISPAENPVVAVAAGTDIIFYSIDGKKLAEIPEAHKDFIGALQFSQKGKLLASGGGDHNVKIWKVPGAVES